MGNFRGLVGNLFVLVLALCSTALAEAPTEAELKALYNRVEGLYEAGKFSDAMPLAERYAAETKARFGENAPEYAEALNNLAELLRLTNRRAEAEPLMRRALAIDEKSYGPNHPEVAINLNNLAKLLQDTNRLTEAEPLIRRALAIAEQSLGKNHPKVTTHLNGLAELLKATNRLAEAEPLYRRALAIDEQSLGRDHPDVATELQNLAQLLRNLNRLAEAEPLYRRALAIDEQSFGRDHPYVARDLNGLAMLLQDTNRLAEAEPLYRRALAINEKSFGRDNPDIASELNNLATLLQATNRLAEAEALMRRVIEIAEKSFGPDHPHVASCLNSLAVLLQDTNRLAEAEPLYRRALAINEKSYGPDHPAVATILDNLAQLLKATNRLTEAELLYRRALAIDEQSLGRDHPDVARNLNNLAFLKEEQGNWAEGVSLHRRAKTSMTHADFKGGVAQYTGELRGYARALFREKAEDPARLAEGFEIAQWALQNEAADALTSMSARFAKGDAALAKLVRDQQDLSHAREAAYRALDQAAGQADAKAAEAARAAIADIEAKLAANAADLERNYKEFAELSNPKPLSIGDAQALLEPSQALVLFLDLWQMGKLPGETLVFALTKKEARWISVSLGRRALEESVTALRCGLDASQWRYGEQSREGCKRLLNTEASEYDTPPFDASLAHALYRDLFSGIEDLVKSKQLLIVSSGPLTQLPFEVLLTQYPHQDDFGLKKVNVGSLGATLDDNLSSTDRAMRKVPAQGAVKTSALNPGGPAEKAGLKPGDIVLSIAGEACVNKEACAQLIQSHAPGTTIGVFVVREGEEHQISATLDARERDVWVPRFLQAGQDKEFGWLGQRQAITVLPSAGSLKALRAAKTSKATAPFIGFGNPLLTGADGTDRSAFAKQRCEKSAPPKRGLVASLSLKLTSLFRSGDVNVEDLRHQPPLPETADELCAVGRTLGVPEAGLDQAIFLGERATVAQVKALSRNGDLARSRVVHFATHGLVAGETALFAKNKAEPSLLLTPPAQASEDDNGLLSASEVAQLSLDADWVVMSACNTAAGRGENAEALSGLARAFFYAGARSLLVSHWPVNSDAAVAITTGAVKALKAEPTIGRAEALRRSVAALIAKGGHHAHPSIWAPFVLVGNGGL